MDPATATLENGSRFEDRDESSTGREAERFRRETQSPRVKCSSVGWES
jgi:hypothetical protein